MFLQSSLNDDVVGGWWHRRRLVPDEQVARTEFERLSESQERGEWQVLKVLLALHLYGPDHVGLDAELIGQSDHGESAATRRARISRPFSRNRIARMRGLAQPPGG